MPRTNSSTPTTRVSEIELDMDADMDMTASTAVASSPAVSVGEDLKPPKVAMDITGDDVDAAHVFLLFLMCLSLLTRLPSHLTRPNALKRTRSLSTLNL